MTGSRATASVQVLALRGERALQWPETVVGEEPLEIRLASPGEASVPVAVTMRTPGNDFELAVGFLFSEGILTGPDELRSVRYCVDAGEQRHNVVTVDLAHPVEVTPRSFPVSASCGVCGTSSMEQLASRCAPLPLSQPIPASTLLGLPGALRGSQPVFDATGGVHAAGLFAGAEPLAVREDVGRHNAVDKLLGWQILEAPEMEPPVLVVSGRVSFEIVQKAAVGRFPVLVAVSAPSSLAVETARLLGVTLVAFARGDRANVYSWPERVLAGR
ncbi:MAG: formate dehydrogenase family accessory protein FdhD [Acidimicrobiaceae bacterium]|nr:formate dehydrogenase family accessory protein FdhD [Acidimicrobiaceae bacterium]